MLQIQLPPWGSPPAWFSVLCALPAVGSDPQVEALRAEALEIQTLLPTHCSQSGCVGQKCYSPVYSGFTLRRELKHILQKTLKLQNYVRKS